MRVLFRATLAASADAFQFLIDLAIFSAHLGVAGLLRPSSRGSAIDAAAASAACPIASKPGCYRAFGSS